MAGLDELIAEWAQHGSVVTVLIVATLLGLRHATDPDHMVAVATLVAAGERRSAARLGAFWGVGHGIALVLCGLPIVLYDTYLPATVERAAEIAIAATIVFLAVRLVVRRRSPAAARSPRSPFSAVAIGLVHGAAGSAGLGVLLLAALPSHAVAVVALFVLALSTAVSMTALTVGLSATLLARGRAYPYATYAMGAFGVVFGLWYAAAV